MILIKAQINKDNYHIKIENNNKNIICIHNKTIIPIGKKMARFVKNKGLKHSYSLSKENEYV